MKGGCELVNTTQLASRVGRELALEPGGVLHAAVRFGMGASLHLEGNSRGYAAFLSSWKA